MKKFYSNINSRSVLKVIFFSSMFSVGCTVFGQIRGDRFPSYEDIAISATLPLGIYLFFGIAAYFMPVTVFEQGIKCYTYNGWYQKVAWEDMDEAYHESVHGLPYVVVESSGHKKPITIPLFLKNMQDFNDLVIRLSDRDNPLAEFLADET